LSLVRDEKRGSKVVQVFEQFIAKLGRIDNAIAQEFGLPMPATTPKDNVKRPHWYKLRLDIYNRDKGICWICHEFVPSNEYELGHIIDRCNGGYSDYDNLAVMHKWCNHHKPRHKTIDEHITWLLKYNLLTDKASHKPIIDTPHTRLSL